MQTVNCSVSAIINQTGSGSKLATAEIRADDIMLIYTQMLHCEWNPDCIDIYNLSVISLELPVSDVFLKVHIYLHRAQCISACLCCSALAYSVCHWLLNSWGVVCWLLPSLLDVCVRLGNKWLQMKKEECEGSVTSGQALSLSHTYTYTHILCHAQITRNNSYALTYSSCHFEAPPLPLSYVSVGNMFPWPRPPMGPQSALTDTHITAE